jgi:hypothetical protein
MSQKKKPKSKPKSKPRTRPAPVATYGQPQNHPNLPPQVSYAPPQAQLLKLDLGCGPNKKPGFFGVDQHAMPGVDHCMDLGDTTLTWPWAEASVEEVHSSHFFEHLTAAGRMHFLNELCRILIPGGKATITTPYWASSRAYGDPSHFWPPIGEMTFFYAVKSWRLVNAPHTDAQWLPGGFTCDFDFTAGYTLHPEVQPRNAELQQKMVTFCKEAAQDMIATLVKPLAPR